jgi:hypothetical protein
MRKILIQNIFFTAVILQCNCSKNAVYSAITVSKIPLVTAVTELLLQFQICPPQKNYKAHFVMPWPYRAFLFLYFIRSGCDFGGHSSFLFLCWRRYGSQSEAAVYCCLWLGILLRQHVFHLCLWDLVFVQLLCSLQNVTVVYSFFFGVHLK